MPNPVYTYAKAMDIVIGNAYSNPSSSPGQGSLYFT